MAVEGEAEVGDLEVAGGGDEEVVGLDVAVNPAEGVGFFNAEDHFGDVPFGDGFGEDVVTNEEAEEVSAGHVIHDEVEIAGVLEAGNQRHDPVDVSP